MASSCRSILGPLLQLRHSSVNCTCAVPQDPSKKMGNKFGKHSKTVAVCGATGKQGGATVEALLALGFAPHHVHALTRDPVAAKAAALAARGITVVKADFDDPASLQAAFQGCDAVFAVTDFWAGCRLDPVRELAQGKNLVDAAKAAGVKHFVFSSLEDPRPLVGDLIQPVNGPYKVPHFEAKAEVDLYMREHLPAGAWTSLITSVFYENLLPGEGMAPSKQPDGSFALFLPTGNAKLAWCSTEDIGGVAAAVIAAGAGQWGGKQVGVAGEHATIAEVAEAVAKVSGKKVAAVTPPAAAWVQAVVGFGVPELAAKDLANMCVFYEKVSMLDLRPLAPTKKIYKGTQSLDSWLAKNKQRIVDGMA